MGNALWCLLLWSHFLLLLSFPLLLLLKLALALLSFGILKGIFVLLHLSAIYLDLLSGHSIRRCRVW
ncbi:hypothetical protein BDV95DRAFT_574992 [Massariosphaeria phaeospora]|uniref:Uncharacterized protein n=1 Tax=Massariosphaeria phaeospora TaxID=100035 RepID=A0A7C8I7D1_9PLEO|nr:hypothetical protein BDV95DRAFT_574992 [Massariosphaeria phaeospora]